MYYRGHAEPLARDGMERDVDVDVAPTTEQLSEMSCRSPHLPWAMNRAGPAIPLRVTGQPGRESSLQSISRPGIGIVKAVAGKA